MCRLFGMTSGTRPVGATFWLIDAPDSLSVQSRRNVDGSGIGYFDQAGQSILDKQPEPAFSDEEFIREAKQAVSTTFVAHVRWATAGSRTVRNTHPFAMRGRIMAHNGGFGELARLDYQLGTYRKLVLGDTDSERYFALITQQIDAHGGDVGAGISAAARWIGERLPVSSLNVIVAAPGELWALRYPGQHALHVIERPAGDSIPAGQHGSATPDGSATPADAAGHAPSPGLHVRSSTSSVHAPGVAVRAHCRGRVGGTRRRARLADARGRRAHPRPVRSQRRVRRGDSRAASPAGAAAGGQPEHRHLRRQLRSGPGGSTLRGARR